MMLPIVKEIPYQSPANILMQFTHEKWLCFLDSAKQLNKLGNYSFIAFNPFLRIVSKNSEVHLNDELLRGDPFQMLQEQLSRYKVATLKDLPPFQGGAAGYFAYDLLHHLENIPKPKSDLMRFPDMVIGFYDSVIAFSHEVKKAWVIAHGFPEETPTLRKQKAEDSCHYILKKLAQKPSIARAKTTLLEKPLKIKSNFVPEDYRQMVQKTIDYIYAGDIFQTNISQCFSASLPEGMSSLDLYLALRNKNPAPFAAFLQYGNISIASASPERFLKLQEKTVEARPIKGTRPRSADPSEDQKLAQELLTSEKDFAENTMIVDLMRNDLSRVCLDHSVKVKKLCGLETYATVHHLVSAVEGTLKPEYDAIDLLRATFPGGSVTGAPKVRAMEIISEFEPTARGPYCGSIGYIGFDGVMDTSITIRTFTIKENKVTFQAGGGIVADSSPAEEYQETLTKASALFKVLMDEKNDIAY